jgi:hypothetical protein
MAGSYAIELNHHKVKEAMLTLGIDQEDLITK